MEHPRVTRDVWAGAVLAALGVFIVVQAVRWDYMGADGPGPGFFPLWYGIVMIVLSLALAVSGATGRTESGEPFAWRKIGQALIVWVAFAAAIGLLPLLGFVIAFGLLVLFIVAVIYRRPMHVALSVAISSAVGFYVIFPVALDVALPAGIFGF